MKPRATNKTQRDLTAVENVFFQNQPWLNSQRFSCESLMQIQLKVQ